MIATIPTEPVGLPGLAVLGVGIALFGAGLLVARARRKPQDKVGGQRAAKSWGGILIQMLGIAVIGFGPINVALDPMGGAALGEAAVVAALMAGAIWLFSASSRAMGRNWAIVASTRSDHQLVTSGPFAYVRNPIYVALLLIGFAFAVAYGHYAGLVLGVPLYLLGTMMRVRIEERLLRDQFGGAYDAYCARVKRFVPGIV
jgi:protein-S-isoprenylcysteine O-methyltransferase Ste14